MSLAVDPLISNILFTLNLLPYFARLGPSAPSAPPKSGSIRPFVTIIVALYKERLEDISITVCSLVDQTYPKNRYEVLFCLEPDDVDTTIALRPCLDRLLEVGVAASLLYTDGTRHTKPYALTTAIARARGDYCAFYDASDTIDPDQVERAMDLMEQGGYDVAQARVFRKGVW
jgi:cellulose synthase/poly-beta-1,6-N-acetylglucosamine synthase-like glycosyltransferase